MKSSTGPPLLALLLRGLGLLATFAGAQGPEFPRPPYSRPPLFPRPPPKKSKTAPPLRDTGTCQANVSYVFAGVMAGTKDSLCQFLSKTVGNLIKDANMTSDECLMYDGNAVSLTATLPKTSCCELQSEFVVNEQTGNCGAYVVASFEDACGGDPEYSNVIQFGSDTVPQPETCELNCDVTVVLANASKAGFYNSSVCDDFSLQISKISGLHRNSFTCNANLGHSFDIVVTASLHPAASQALLQSLSMNNNSGAKSLIKKFNYDCQAATLTVEAVNKTVLTGDGTWISLTSCGESYIFKSEPCGECSGSLPSLFRWLNESEVTTDYTFSTWDVLCVDGERVFPGLFNRTALPSSGIMKTPPCDPADRYCNNAGDYNENGNAGLGSVIPIDSFSDSFVDVMFDFTTADACCQSQGQGQSQADLGVVPTPNCQVTWNLGDTFMLSPVNVVVKEGNTATALVSDSRHQANFTFTGSVTMMPLQTEVGPGLIALSTPFLKCQDGAKIQIPGNPSYVRLMWAPYGMPPPPLELSPPPLPLLPVPAPTQPVEESSSVQPLAIGLGVGLGLLVLILASVVGFLLYRRSRHKRGEPNMTSKGKGSPSPPPSTTNGTHSEGVSKGGTLTLTLTGGDHIKAPGGSTGGALSNGSNMSSLQGVDSALTNPLGGLADNDAAPRSGDKPVGLPPLPPGRTSLNGDPRGLAGGHQFSENSSENEHTPFAVAGRIPSWMTKSSNGSTLAPLASELPGEGGLFNPALGQLGQHRSGPFLPVGSAGPSSDLAPYSLNSSKYNSGQIASPVTVLSSPSSTFSTKGVSGSIQSSMIPENAIALSPDQAGFSSRTPTVLDPSSTTELPSEGSQSDASALFCAYAQLAADILSEDSIPPGPSTSARSTSWQALSHKSGSMREDVDLGMEFSELIFEAGGGGLLGAGAVGSVYRATFRGQVVAVKVITQNVVDGHFQGSTTDSDSLHTEIQILSRLQHPNIVHLFGGCLRPPRVFIVEELMSSTLSSLVHHRKQRVSLERILLLALDMARGLAYLHNLNVIHRDLKPANILLDENGVAKISDFGLARCKYKTYLETKQTDAGTVAYMAPEAFNPDIGGISTKCDVFSLGVIMWEMLSQQYPWDGQPNMVIIYRVAVQTARCSFPEDDVYFPQPIKDMITKCWAQEPRNRPDISQVLSELEIIASSYHLDITPRAHSVPRPLSKHPSTASDIKGSRAASGGASRVPSQAPSSAPSSVLSSQEEPSPKIPLSDLKQ